MTRDEVYWVQLAAVQKCQMTGRVNLRCTPEEVSAWLELLADTEAGKKMREGKDEYE